MGPIFLPTHTVCAFFFFFTVFQFLKILDLAWPLSIQPQRTLLFRPWRRTIHVWPLGAVRGCNRYTVIVLCSDQHWLLHAVSSLSSLTVGEKRMLFRDKSTSLTINYTHVFPAVFSAFFQMAWSSEFRISLIFANEMSSCLWIMAPHAHKTDFASAEHRMIMVVWSVTPAWSFHEEKSSICHGCLWQPMTTCDE